jgi:hypothetical protein
MNPLRLGIIFLVLPAFVPAATPPASKPATPPSKKASSSEWVFSLLPKSLQRNPRLELTVITEMTEAGKQLPPVSTQTPAYFEAFSPGPRHLGHSQGNEATPKQAEIERLLFQALATNGYLPAKPPAVPPSLLIIYTWGSHNLLTEGDDENPSLSGEQIARNLLDRAALVGGEKFARRLLDLFQQADAMNVAASARPPPGGEQVFTPAMAEFANPVSMFKRSDPKNEFLVDQAASDVYYVVASAYDHKSVIANRRVLFWRTRMTVASQGVSADQSFPTLVSSAAPFFGREMAEPEILSKRAMREGSVEIGTPTVVDPAAPSKK